MTALYVIGGIVLALALLGFVPLMPDAEYNSGGFSMRVRIWFIPIRVGGGRRTGGESPDKTDKKEKKEKKPPSPRTVRLLIKHGYAALCRVVKRCRVDILYLRFTAASPDPAAAAMEYAAAGAALDGLLAIGGERIRRADVRADVNFDGERPVIDLRLRLSIRLYQLIGAAARFGVGFFIESRREKREEKQHAKSSDR